MTSTVAGVAIGAAGQKELEFAHELSWPDIGQARHQGGLVLRGALTLVAGAP